MTQHKRRGARKTKHVGRGLLQYCKFMDGNGTEIRVQSSSAATGPCCWIFAENDPRVFKNPSPHLNAAQVKRLIAALEKFLTVECGQ